MSALERLMSQEFAGDKQKFIAGTVGGSTTLTVDEQLVRVTPPTSSTHTVKLPTVAEARGRIYVVESISDGGGTVVVVTHDDDSPVMSDATLTTTGDVVMVYSTGWRWLTLVDITT